nr:MAG TPA: hypothetical protein [Caudoviricetes sp.]DAV81863.1 MAG TPA: hypothetical protein [Caudoviricetes sp.]
MCDIIILIGCDFSRNALKRQAFRSAAFLFYDLWYNYLNKSTRPLEEAH